MFSQCLGRRPPAALVSIASAIVATCLCAGSAHGDGLADMAGTWRFRTRVGDTVFSDCVFISPDVMSGDDTVVRFTEVCVGGVRGAAGEGADGSIVVVLPTPEYCQVWKLHAAREARVQGSSDFLDFRCDHSFVDGSVQFPFRGTRARCRRPSACRGKIPSP
jgi:hypothetical protein